MFLEIDLGSKKGDGYAADIMAVQFQATFNDEKVEKNYIAKFAPEGKRGEILQSVYNFMNRLLGAIQIIRDTFWLILDPLPTQCDIW